MFHKQAVVSIFSTASAAAGMDNANTANTDSKIVGTDIVHERQNNLKVYLDENKWNLINMLNKHLFKYNT